MIETVADDLQVHVVGEGDGGPCMAESKGE